MLSYLVCKQKLAFSILGRITCLQLQYRDTLFQVNLCCNKNEILSHLRWLLEKDIWFSPIALLNIWKSYCDVCLFHSFNLFLLFLHFDDPTLHDGIHKWCKKFSLCTLCHFTHQRCHNSSNPVIIPYAGTTLVLCCLFKKLCFTFSYVDLDVFNSCFKVTFGHSAVLPIIQWRLWFRNSCLSGVSTQSYW